MTFFPILKKKIQPNLKKKIIFFLEDQGFSFSHHSQATWWQSTTIESYFSFNFLMAKVKYNVCVIIANLFCLFFLLTKNGLVVH